MNGNRQVPQGGNGEQQANDDKQRQQQQQQQRQQRVEKLPGTGDDTTKPRRIDREEAEKNIPADPDPDDPASS